MSDLPRLWRDRNLIRLTSSYKPCSRLPLLALIPLLMSTRCLVSMEMMVLKMMAMIKVRMKKKPLKPPMLKNKLRKRNAQNKSNANKKRSNSVSKKKRRTLELNNTLKRLEHRNNKLNNTHFKTRQKKNNACSLCKMEMMMHLNLMVSRNNLPTSTVASVDKMMVTRDSSSERLKR
jgi:hypothetical protein